MENKKPAGFAVRLLAFLVDLVLLALILSVLILILSQSRDIASLGSNFMLLLVAGILPVFTLSIFYYAVLTSKLGGTVGKLASGLVVLGKDGQNLPLKLSIFRYSIGYQFAFLLFGLGFLAIIKDPEKRGWHDKTVGSRVVKVAPTWPIGLILLALLVFGHYTLIKTAVANLQNNPAIAEITTVSKQQTENLEDIKLEDLQNQTDLELNDASNYNLDFIQE